MCSYCHRSVTRDYAHQTQASTSQYKTISMLEFSFSIAVRFCEGTCILLYVLFPHFPILFLLPIFISTENVSMSKSTHARIRPRHSTTHLSDFGIILTHLTFCNTVQYIEHTHSTLTVWPLYHLLENNRKKDSLFHILHISRKLSSFPCMLQPPVNSGWEFQLVSLDKN